MARHDTLTALRTGTPVVHRGNGCIQVGCDPDRGLVIQLPTTLRADDVVAFLRFLATARTPTEIRRTAGRWGLDEQVTRDLLDRLRDAGMVAEPDATEHARSLRVRLHGRGPLTTRLTTLLREASIPMTVSAQRPRTAQGAADAPLASWDEGLVVLTDHLSHDPAIVGGLMSRGIAHMPVRLRDGSGIIGPLVLPGRTSCLRCADHHRADRDPGWPLVAGQMIGQVGHASAATVAATAALAMEQIEQVGHGLRRSPPAPDGSRVESTAPQIIDHTLEYLPQPARLRVRRWEPHPLCSCLFRR
ncbi:hypothetical protein [Williamsia herbipolensis]|uniref:hypothetical protein n=1 Tax=Williamsia herbipolensis TaxID=1603258 RepID=UPI0005F896BA|nr:hypothetical protein [Williamsia herbipolensis]